MKTDFLLSFLRKYYLTASCLSAILLLSVLPIPAATPAPMGKYSDKCIHGLMYASLSGILLFERIRNRVGSSNRMTLRAVHLSKRREIILSLQVLWVATAWGVGMEFLQGFTGFRSFCYYDMLANFAGALLGIALLEAIRYGIRLKSSDNQ